MQIRFKMMNERRLRREVEMDDCIYRVNVDACMIPGMQRSCIKLAQTTQDNAMIFGCRQLAPGATKRTGTRITGTVRWNEMRVW